VSGGSGGGGSGGFSVKIAQLKVTMQRAREDRYLKQAMSLVHMQRRQAQGPQERQEAQEGQEGAEGAEGAEGTEEQRDQREREREREREQREREQREREREQRDQTEQLEQWNEREREQREHREQLERREQWNQWEKTRSRWSAISTYMRFPVRRFPAAPRRMKPPFQAFTFCEVCDNFFLPMEVTWYERSFRYDGRWLRSACRECEGCVLLR
jgi:hypothetical protein